MAKRPQSENTCITDLHINHFPCEILATIISQFLTPFSRTQCRFVCHHWHNTIASLKTQLYWYRYEQVSRNLSMEALEGAEGYKRMCEPGIFELRCHTFFAIRIIPIELFLVSNDKECMVRYDDNSFVHGNAIPRAPPFADRWNPMSNGRPLTTEIRLDDLICPSVYHCQFRYLPLCNNK